MSFEPTFVGINKNITTDAQEVSLYMESVTEALIKAACKEAGKTFDDVRTGNQHRPYHRKGDHYYRERMGD